MNQRRSSYIVDKLLKIQSYVFLKHSVYYVIDVFSVYQVDIVPNFV